MSDEETHGHVDTEQEDKKEEVPEGGDEPQEEREEVVEEECQEIIYQKRKSCTACSEEMNDRVNSQNAVIQPLLTDLYQITMAYAYWKAKRIEEKAVFDLFFRKNPFHGEFTIFAGLSECLKFLENFRYSESGMLFLSFNFKFCCFINTNC